ncbi:MAG: hypothetical protein MUE30_02435 [Spirosomaceae bacterium]|jgi:hypothetical protein|nr:hypothetical protein [Spirosomataceae bacterium]
MTRILSLLLFWATVAHAQIDLDKDSSAVPEVPNFKRLDYGSIGTHHNLTHLPNMQRQIALIGDNRRVLFNQGITAQYGFYFNRFKVGYFLEGQVSFAESSSSSIVSSYSTIMGGFTGGYVASQNRNRRWLVNVAVGMVESNLKAKQRSQPNATISMNTVLTTPITGFPPTLKHNNLFVELSLENTYRPKRANMFGASYLLGVRRGLNQRAWKMENFNLQNAPTDRILQLFAAVCVTFSTRGRLR